MHLPLLPYQPERDAYRLLGVSPAASIDEINAACRRLARTFHPDHNRSERATAEMAVVNAVRRMMVDPTARAAYDRQRRTYLARIRPREPVAVEEPMRTPEPEAGRYVSALVSGVRAAVRALAPPRCRGCRAVLTSERDAYCAACGTPVLTGG